MNDSYKNLLLALQQIEVTPDPVPEYRFYYDKMGKITNCSAFNHQEGDNFIVVSQEQYDNYTKYEIRNRQLVKLADPNRVLSALTRSNTGFGVVKGHAGLLLESGEEYTNIEYYDARNN
jgi:hypothetical protein